ncbi:hypothetical protein B7463_g3113, partial [Scytalidium lignicola]
MQGELILREVGDADNPLLLVQTGLERCIYELETEIRDERKDEDVAMADEKSIVKEEMTKAVLTIPQRHITQLQQANMTMSTPYKPSPLSYGSPRSSPFRRPESPASPSPLRQSTPNPNSSSSPTRQSMNATSTTTPSKLVNSSTPKMMMATVESDTETEPDVDTASWTPKGLTPTRREREPSPTRGARSGSFGPMLGVSSPSSRGLGAARGSVDNNAISKLAPAQVRELREGFQTLDRDSDGLVGREDVAEMLTQLGLPSTPSDISQFFPPSHPQTLTLPTYLTTLATLLSTLSPPSELISAFSAFDEDDSGQVDVAELRDALLHTAPETGERPLTEREIDQIMGGFVGRRAFSKHSGLGRKGDVFRYTEFVSSVLGGSTDGKGGKDSDD